jgi:hypothetical protein
MGNETSKGGQGPPGGPGAAAGGGAGAVPGAPSPGTRPDLKPPPRDPLYHSACSEERGAAAGDAGRLDGVSHHACPHPPPVPPSAPLRLPQ